MAYMVIADIMCGIRIAAADEAGYVEKGNKHLGRQCRDLAELARESKCETSTHTENIGEEPEYIIFGVDFKEMNGDETLNQFKSRIQTKLEAVFGELERKVDLTVPVRFYPM